MNQDRAKKLSSLLARLRSRRDALPELAPCAEGEDPVLREFLLSMLVWESTLAKAEAALRRVDEAAFDLNEFRVFLADEMAGVLGSTYPLGPERARRLKDALHGLYRAEHCLKLFHLLDKPKRDARAYLDSLGHQPPVNGSGQPAEYQVVPPFVTARVLLLALGGHAFPLDSRIRARLAQAGVLDEETPLAECAAWLERTLRAGEIADAYRLIQAWSDEGGTPVVKAKRPPTPKALRAAKGVGKRRVGATPPKRTPAGVPRAEGGRRGRSDVGRRSK